MNVAHAHLLINHVPVLGTAGGILATGWGRLRRSRDLEAAGLLTLSVCGGAVLAVSAAGAAAGRALARIVHEAQPAIDAHARAAVPATLALLATAIVAIAALVLWRRAAAAAARLSLIALVAGVVAFALAARTADAGGAIRHPELRGLASAAAASGERWACTGGVCARERQP